jgi:hypothetical protein
VIRVWIPKKNLIVGGVLRLRGEDIGNNMPTSAPTVKIVILNIYTGSLISYGYNCHQQGWMMYNACILLMNVLCWCFICRRQAEHLNSGVAYCDLGKLDIKLVAQNKFHLPSGLVFPSHFYKIWKRWLQ